MQQQVLQHVDLQQQGRERLNRRRKGQEEHRQASQESNQLALRPAPRTSPMKHQPTAQIDAGSQQERDVQPRLERPGAYDGVERGVHLAVLAAVTVGQSPPVVPVSDLAGAG